MMPQSVLSFLYRFDPFQQLKGRFITLYPSRKVAIPLKFAPRAIFLLKLTVWAKITARHRPSFGQRSSAKSLLSEHFTQFMHQAQRREAN